MRQSCALLQQQRPVADMAEVATMTTTNVGITCSCGSDKFEMPENPKDSDIIKCAKCGAAGKYGDVMKQATSQAKAAVEKELKDALRKAGFK